MGEGERRSAILFIWEGCMNVFCRSMAVLVLAGVGLTGCAHDWGTDAHPTTAADLQAVLRDEWSRHLFWTRNVVLDIAKNDRRSRRFAENAVATNIKDIARTFQPFYGDAVSDQLHALLTKHYEAIQAYSEATVAKNVRQQDVAMTLLMSNNDDLAALFSRINPHLSKDAVRSALATHVEHHVTQITKFQERDYAGEEEAWPAMEHHVYVIADMLAIALQKQFPSKFM